MAVTAASFLEHFPEFEPGGTELIEAKIAEAEPRVDPNFWGSDDLRDLAIMYRVGHLLALSPYGVAAKMVSKDGSTTYWKHYLDLVNENGSGAFAL